MTQARPDTLRVLARLKDFQRTSVDYVFRRLYTDADPTHRFLVADEVGLGKTLVAKGIIAKVIERLWSGTDRIDIVYICSNAEIARQNICRLNITRDNQFALASRITLLPTRVRDLKNRRLNFISLTPSTSFELKSSLGRQEERALLHDLLAQAWSLRGTGSLNVLQGNASPETFRATVRSFREDEDIDDTLAEAFARTLQQSDSRAAREGRPTLRARFDDLCQRFGRLRKNVPPEDQRDRRELVGELRDLLATTCIEALEPDLVILDEFQRFKHLLDGRDPASVLARHLFEYPEVRVLLLSATPYKMYTLTDEATDDDHYEDFVRTLRFLQANETETAAFEKTLAEYRQELFRLGDDGVEHLRHLKENVERVLQQVMVRTERLAVTGNRDGMLIEVPSRSTTLEARDLDAYLALQAVARAVDYGDTMEFWKSAPYLLNFMDDYALKHAVEEAAEDPERRAALAAALRRHPGGLLSWQDIVQYSEIDPANARLRGLLADTVDMGAWQLLWIPSALSYYRASGPYASEALRGLTKRLVFSSWRVVPRVIASLLSYAAERRMIRSLEDSPENTPDARRRRTALLRFTRADMRLTGMPVLGIMYPCSTLARICDPLGLLGEEDGEDGPTIETTLERAQRKIEPLLSELEVTAPGPGAQADETWYWAAPILLDLRHGGEAARTWFADPGIAARWAGEVDRDNVEEASVWNEHVELARKLLSRSPRLGPKPPDLTLVLAQMSLGAPGIVALRGLARVSGGHDALTKPGLRDSAAQIAWAFRGLFNIPEVIALVRGLNHEEPYWRRVVEYCVAGGLQAVIDEYVHVLRELLGLLDESTEVIAKDLAEAMCGALSIRTVTLRLDELRVTDGSSRMVQEDRGFRARFALRLDTDKVEGGDDETRADQARLAFNSPFWPFVLATTSVGQEGLDFHPYCHAVVHWNLPSNPVDLEQREGRVHRYKGHAIRRNLAKRFGVPRSLSDGSDPWERLFEQAKAGRRSNDSDLVPYWVYPLEGGAKIERHVPMLPLSRDREHLAALLRSLAVYRMIFGQPRQEDLVSYLLTRFTSDHLAAMMENLRIDLSPKQLRVDAEEAAQRT